MLPPKATRRFWNSVIPKGIHQFFSPYYRWRSRMSQVDWSKKTNSSEFHRPEQYSPIDKKTLIVADAVDRYGGPDRVVLDLCCNVGRNLAELANRGYRLLQGVDVNPNAIRLSAFYFPVLAETAQMVVSPVERFLSTASTKGVDTIISRGTTLEFVSPDYPLVQQMCRISRQTCILLLQTAADPYPRFWPYEFARCGFTLVEFRHELAGKANLFCFASPEYRRELERFPF
jgi:SAM-dependent methyltransferase